MNQGLNDRLRRCELRSTGYVVFRRPPGWDVEDSEGALVLDSETGSTPSDVSDLESAMSLCSEQVGEINERLDSALIVPPRQDADAVPSAPSDCRDNVDVSLPTPSIHSDPPGSVPAVHWAIGGPLQVPSGLLNQSPSPGYCDRYVAPVISVLEGDDKEQNDEANGGQVEKTELCEKIGLGE